MSPTEAARLLEVAPDATPEQLETRFLELRAKLEDKIAKAPTPGLKEKYRASLAEITTAFETLTLAADSSELPVLQRAERKAEVAATPVKSATAPAAVEPVTKPAAKAKTGGNREFLVVAVIAVALLAGGGWWIMKTRAEAAEKARVETQSKADAEKDKARQETLFAQLRASQAELKIRWDAVEKELTTAERKLSELKADTRNTRDVPAPQVAELQAQYAAEGDFVEWLQPYVARHPVKTLLAKLDALLATKAVDAAASLPAEMTASLTAAEQEIAAQKKALLALGRPLRILTDPEGLRFRVTDAYGRTQEGTAPATVSAPWGRAEVVVTSPGRGWPDVRRELRITRDAEAAMNATFARAAAHITSVPAGLAYELTNTAGLTLRGRTPADLTEVPTGAVTLKVSRPEWPDVVVNATIKADQPNELTASFTPGKLAFTSEPSGATVFIGKERVGVTPVTIEGLIPGEKTVLMKLKGYTSMNGKAVVRAADTVTVGATLERVNAPEEGQRYTIPELGLKLEPITAGSFVMGSPAEETGRDTDEGQVRVTLTQPYWLGQTEVTQAEWAAVMGNNPSKFQGSTNPVEQVSYDDVLEFCRKLTARERAAERLPEGYAYTLPTEAQWEYACRAGTSGPYSGSLDAMGWYKDNSGSTTHAVGGKQANAWGLYDMHGNVWEWCLDWKGPYAGGTNPTGASSGSLRVFRGGGWGSDAGLCRSAFRDGLAPGARSIILGFRLALSPTIR